MATAAPPPLGQVVLLLKECYKSAIHGFIGVLFPCYLSAIWVLWKNSTRIVPRLVLKVLVFGTDPYGTSLGAR